MERLITDDMREQQFGSLGEQLKAIIQIGTPGGRRDARLEMQIRASGMSESVPSEGGFLVQPKFIDQLIAPVWSEGEIPSRVTKLRMSNGNESTIPAIEEISRADGSRWGGVQMYWECEAEEKTKSKPTFRMVTVALNKLIGLCYMTDELSADSALLESIVGRAFQAETDYMLTNAIIKGTGAGMPLGIITAPGTITQAKETGQPEDTVIYDNIVNMWARLIPSSRAKSVWMINQNIEPQLNDMVSIVGTAGVPVYQPAGQVRRSATPLLFGQPVLLVEQCPTLGDPGDIILGDLSKYVAIDGGSLRRDVSIHVRFVYDERVLRFVYRVDGQPTLHRPIVPINSLTTVSHFVILGERPTLPRSILPGVDCAVDCSDCEECYSITVAGLTGNCLLPCSVHDGVYTLRRSGATTCEWTYADGIHTVARIHCEDQKWWLRICDEVGAGNPDLVCAIWSYPVAEAALCPPLEGTAWNWESGLCTEGTAVSSAC